MKSLYKNLAEDGIKRHKRLYYPFIGTTVFFIVLINLCLSISADPVIETFFGATTIGTLMDLGSIILLIFALLTISQNYNFIQKNKADESALYLMLGMEKKHLIKIYLHELLILYLRSLIIGTLISLISYKLVFAGFLKLMNSDINVLESGIFPVIQPLVLTALIFLAIFALLLLKQIFKNRNFTPLNYMQESKAGQKAPKHPVIIGILGIICIGLGYYISLSTDNPMKAFRLFFVAVLLVILGTYLAFSVIISGILKLLQKNKRFYYKKSNFTAVSGLIYRVKNSANTLASIAVLSTMVIVVLTSGFSLYFGTIKMQDQLYPTDYKMSFPKKEESLDYYEKLVANALKEENKTAKINSFKSNYFLIDKNGTIITKRDSEATLEEEFGGSSFLGLYLDENSTYNFNGADAILLSDDQDYNITKIEGKDLKINKEKEENYPTKFPSTDITMTNTSKLVFKDPKLFKEVTDSLKISDDPRYDENWNITFDVDGPYDPQLKENLWKKFADTLSDQWFSLSDGKADRAELLAMYAGIFFVGIILGLGFLVSTVLAIYYKQLSEGLDDRARFKTMRQLGMTDKEAKKSISKQMGLVFFLPLVFAFIHSLFALPIITEFLKMLGLTNTGLFIKCLLAVFAAYILFYLITFKMTEKTYNNIILKER